MNDNCNSCCYKVFANKFFDEAENEERNYNVIEVTLDSGDIVTWESDKGEWDDYAYDGIMFIIVKDGIRVGFYNVNNIVSVIVR